MVILDKYHDEDQLTEPSANGHTDAPPSYETVSTACSGQPAHLFDEKLPRQSGFPAPHNSSIPTSGTRVGTTPSRPVSGHSQPGPSSWLPRLSFTSSRTSKQVQQTVLALIRDLVLNAESPNLLGSCSDACRTYDLNLSTLLQEPFIENHSAIYWGILNRRDALLPSLLVHAAPLSQSTMSEIRLACLTSSNQHLFQSLRCQREPFTKQMTPLSTNPGADALILGSMPSDEVLIHEMDGQGAFVAEMRINLWQKRMRVSGRVSVEFIARGRIWSLTFFSPLSTTHTTVGIWQVALCLLEHSPPTFIDSRLVIDLPPPSSILSTSPANASQPSDLISLSPPPDHSSSSTARSLPPPSPPLLNKFKSKSKAPQSVEVRLKNVNRLAYRASDTSFTALDVAFSSQKDWSPPHVEQWSDNDGSIYTNAIVVPLDNGAGAELLYDNTPFIAIDGTLHVRLEARLGRPDATECVIC
ncbi:hypothetical protein J3R82DRAFT_3303 [Butyriboletus roseoflavus]|nr:hypothetical protein J3R82DRAFT_3303 [Butyriboletus roseoflavus]